ncbi:hypothetical protein NDU88_005505 [Pleurodeles waltl]|uniref:Uncharacterized protein n=1 Tax=Pleurodeles waltl TaxID=8319 RepID=A0AAV7WXU4_PLEWA|nr:hypothetical protein NDU88_005505 [Pleurodeles waltl]
MAASAFAAAAGEKTKAQRPRAAVESGNLGQRLEEPAGRAVDPEQARGLMRAKKRERSCKRSGDVGPRGSGPYLYMLRGLGHYLSGGRRGSYYLLLHPAPSVESTAGPLLGTPGPTNRELHQSTSGSPGGDHHLELAPEESKCPSGGPQGVPDPNGGRTQREQNQVQFSASRPLYRLDAQEIDSQSSPHALATSTYLGSI